MGLEEGRGRLGRAIRLRRRSRCVVFTIFGPTLSLFGARTDTFMTTLQHRTATPTPESAAAVIDEPTRAKTPTPTTSAVESQSDPKEKEKEREEQVVHNPEPAVRSSLGFPLHFHPRFRAKT